MAEKTIHSLFSSPMMNETLNAFFVNHPGKRPKIFVAPILNATSDATTQTGNLDDAIKTGILQSGLFSLVGDEKRMATAIINEANDILVTPETSSGFSNQSGADYILTGKLTELDDQDGRIRERVYILSMQLDNLYTYETEWMSREVIRKVSHRAVKGKSLPPGRHPDQFLRRSR